MRLWVTRTRPGADRLAAELRGLGHDPLVAPLTKVVPIRAPTDLSKASGLILTSAAAVPASAGRALALPVWCVGEGTAQAARQAGFRRVDSVDGDAEALIAHLADAGIEGLVWLRGQRVSVDVAARLTDLGLPTRSVETYRVEPLLCTSAFRRLEDGALDGVVFQSLGAVEAFVAGLERHGLFAALGDITAFALSDRIAGPLSQEPFAEVRVADQPTTQALLTLLGKPPAAV